MKRWHLASTMNHSFFRVSFSTSTYTSHGRINWTKIPTNDKSNNNNNKNIQLKSHGIWNNLSNLKIARIKKQKYFSISGQFLFCIFFNNFEETKCSYHDFTILIFGQQFVSLQWKQMKKWRKKWLKNNLSGGRSKINKTNKYSDLLLEIFAVLFYDIFHLNYLWLLLLLFQSDSRTSATDNSTFQTIQFDIDLRPTNTFQIEKKKTNFTVRYNERMSK